MPIETQIVILYAATRGYLDKMGISEIPRFQEAVLREISSDVLAAIREKRVISDELNTQLKKFFDNFTDKFLATSKIL